MGAYEWSLTRVNTKVVKEVVPLAENAVSGVFLFEAGFMVALQDSHLPPRTRVSIGVDAVLVCFGDMLLNANTLQVKMSSLCDEDLVLQWDRIEK